MLSKYRWTPLIWTLKGWSKLVSVLERCPYCRGHEYDVTPLPFWPSKHAICTSHWTSLWILIPAETLLLIWIFQSANHCTWPSCEHGKVSALFLIDDSDLTPVRDYITVEDVVHEEDDMDLEDSDFEPGADRDLLGVFFPEVRIAVNLFWCCFKRNMIL